MASHEAPKPGTFRKGPGGPAPQYVRPKRLPATEIRNIPVMPGKTLASKIIKPVGAALFLLASIAHGQTVISAPFAGQGACPFMGCRQVAGTVLMVDPPYSLSVGGDQTGKIQQAIDSGAAILQFPPGTYQACNLVPRGQNQIWRGAGKHQTILQATPGCVNLIVLSAGGGPATSWEVTGFTIKSNGATNGTLINMDGGTVLRGYIHDNAFDVGTGYTTGQTASTAIQWSGGADLRIEGNECYSVLPGYGNCFTLFRAARNTRILDNTWRWVFNGVQVDTLQGTEDFNIGDNTGDLGWYAEPVKYTGTANYSATSLTDLSGNNFTGLCADAGTPGTCSVGTGNFIRVLSTAVTGTGAATFFAPGIIGDSGISTATVARGQLVRTVPVCRGNGSLGPTRRHTCTGGTGNSLFGDGCGCTTNADCGSGLCEKRFATVMGVIDGTHIAIDEWTSDVDRRPVGAPIDGTSYTVFSWLMAAVHDYTSSVININTNTSGWFDWFGNPTTPTNGQTYEILTKHPNYQILVASTAAVVQKGRIHDNTLMRGHSDQIGANAGQNFTISGNQISDGQDVGITIDGITGVGTTGGGVVSGNIIDHQGSIGVFIGGNDITVANNVMQNISWANSANTVSLGCTLAQGGNRANITGNKCLQTIAMALNRYAWSIAGTTDGTRFSNNQAQGTFTVGPYRFAAVTVTNAHIMDYAGEVISTSGGPTYSIEGGLGTQLQVTGNLANNGSYVGCSDCTSPSNPCTSGGGGSTAFRTGGAWKCP